MKELCDILREMTALFREFLPLEEEKLKAAQRKQVTFIEDCMGKEQALLLKIRGLEQKRESFLEQKGLQGRTLREIIAEQPEEEQRELTEVFEEFSSAVKTFSALNTEAMKLIRVNLHELENAVKAKEGSTYSKNKEAAEPIPHLTDRIV